MYSDHREEVLKGVREYTQFTQYTQYTQYTPALNGLTEKKI